MIPRHIVLSGAALVALAACGVSSAPTDAHLSAAPTATATATASAAAPATAAATATAPATASATAPEPAVAEADAGASDAGAPAQPYVADNKVLPPPTSDELTARARGLFEAIVNDDPARGEAFWFPKEPFIPLKDVKGPDKYWEQLHRTYAHDIHALHKKRKSWDGATFVGFELGSTPKWVPPGDEGNKIGYYRTFRGKLRYRIDEKDAEIEVRVIISWQGRWYITHLSKFKK
jgi:hypothetical protein